MDSLIFQLVLHLSTAAQYTRNHHWNLALWIPMESVPTTTTSLERVLAWGACPLFPLFHLSSGCFKNSPAVFSYEHYFAERWDKVPMAPVAQGRRFRMIQLQTSLQRVACPIAEDWTIRDNAPCAHLLQRLDHCPASLCNAELIIAADRKIFIWLCNL